METAAWERVRGDTWCVQMDVTVPVYFLNDREAVLLDSGYPHDRAALEGLLAERGVRVRAILGSHSHWDHNGSHAYFQKTHGAEVILRDVEAAIASDYAAMTAAYFPATAADMARELPDMRVRADRTFSAGDTQVEIGGHVFGLVPLPGHTPGHTGVVTPDGVLYAGDALMSPEALAKAKLPTVMDWAQDLASKERLRGERCSAVILAHRGVFADIGPVIDENIADRRRRAEQVMGWLSQRPSWTVEDVERFLWQKYGLRTTRFLTQTIFRRNVRCLLAYLAGLGRLERRIEEGVETYIPTGKARLPDA